MHYISCDWEDLSLCIYDKFISKPTRYYILSSNMVMELHAVVKHYWLDGTFAAWNTIMNLILRSRTHVCFKFLKFLLYILKNLASNYAMIVIVKFLNRIYEYIYFCITLYTKSTSELWLQDRHRECAACLFANFPMEGILWKKIDRVVQR